MLDIQLSYLKMSATRHSVGTEGFLFYWKIPPFLKLPSSGCSTVNAIYEGSGSLRFNPFREFQARRLHQDLLQSLA